MQKAVLTAQEDTGCMCLSFPAVEDGVITFLKT